MSIYDQLIELTATQAAEKLASGEISPLDLIDAAADRITKIEPELNALPTLCLERARDHAKSLMNGKRRDLEGQRGWLGGLPVTIKDTIDTAGVRTTYGSPIFKDHVPDCSHPLVKRIEDRGGIVIAKSNTPEFACGGSTFNEVFGRTKNPWNTSLTCGGSTGGGAVSLATGEAWLAHGSDHAGSMRVPAIYNGVVGMRPSAGRVTRGTEKALFSPLLVEGPMARNVPDLALFLDTMAGWCVLDPLTYDAPATSYVDSMRPSDRPLRIAYSGDYHGQMAVDRETLALCTKAMKVFEAHGHIVEEVAPDLASLSEAAMVLRSQAFVVEREEQLNVHRELLKPDIIWNTELGLESTPSRLAWADRERSAFYSRMASIFSHYDIFITPAAATPAFGLDLRSPSSIGGIKRENYMDGSMITFAITMAGCPGVTVPCDVDQYGRFVGLQFVAAPRRDDVAIRVAGMFEQLSSFRSGVPIMNPRPGTVPPVEGPPN